MHPCFTLDQHDARHPKHLYPEKNTKKHTNSSAHKRPNESLRYCNLSSPQQQNSPFSNSDSLAKWLSNFLSGWNDLVFYSGVSSQIRPSPNGVPQGSVSSPSFFNLIIADIPKPLGLFTLASFADDLTIYFHIPHHLTAAQQLQTCRPKLELWLSNNRLHISTPKFTITLLTSSNSEIWDHHQVVLDSALIRTGYYPSDPVCDPGSHDDSFAEEVAGTSSSSKQFGRTTLD